MMCSTPAARECKPKKKGARANLCNALSLPVESVANPNDVVEDVFAQEIADLDVWTFMHKNSSLTTTTTTTTTTV